MSSNMVAMVKRPHAYTATPANVKLVLQIPIVQTVFLSMIVFYVDLTV